MLPGHSRIVLGLIAVILFVSLVLHVLVQPFKRTQYPDTLPYYTGWFLRRLGLTGLSEYWIDFNERVTLNQLEAASLSASLVLFLTAASITDSEERGSAIRTILIAVSLALHVSFVFFMVCRLFCTLHTCFDLAAEEKGISFGTASGVSGNRTRRGRYRSLGEPLERNTRAEIDSGEQAETWLLVKIWKVLSFRDHSTSNFIADIERNVDIYHD